MNNRWIQMVFVSLIEFLWDKIANVYNASNSLLCCRELQDHELTTFSLAWNFQRNRNKLPKRHFVAIQQLLLILSGTVEINPGPMRKKVKFPCGQCSKAVKNTDNSIACDTCNLWYHQECASLGYQTFDCYTNDETLVWTCTQCALTDSSFSFEESADVPDIQPKKSKQLRVCVCNFQSIWNKISILQNFLTSNNIDILLGSETHLSCNISNCELFPESYTALRKDRNDGYGGVIIIYKKELLVEEITHKKGELV